MADIPIPVPIGVSARHIHLSQEHLDVLFGKGYQLHSDRELTQRGQYASEERLKLIGPKGVIEKVRILGPVRLKTQVELARTDALLLGVKAPVRESGFLERAADVVLEGPAGSVNATESAIVALRHLHMGPEDSWRLGVRAGQKVCMRIEGERGGALHNTVVRIHPTFTLDFHIDTDEANALGVVTGDKAFLSVFC